jgi:nitroreductase
VWQIIMSEILKIIQERHSTRAPFDPEHPIAKKDILQILEAARWAPTAHNMQNFEIIVVDDSDQIETLGSIKSRISEEFLRENYEQLSFTDEELIRRKVGILGTRFPPSWRTPGDWSLVAREAEPSSLDQTIKDSPTLLIVTYDARKRAPASEGDVLGFMSLGCVMENMWLMAQSLGLSFHILSVFGNEAVEKEVRKILKIPEHMKIAFACRLGHSVPAQRELLRVRRDIEDFVHHNAYGAKGVD